MPIVTSTLFISAVTDEFKSYREATVELLKGPEVRIQTQEQFQAFGDTMLLKLNDYIQKCDAVVHLVGDRTGSATNDGRPNAAALSALLNHIPQLPALLGLDEGFIRGLSYTQWEAWLAVLHKRKLFVAVPEIGAPRDKQLSDPSQAERQHQSQQEHLKRLVAHGRYPEITFSNSDRLCLGLLPLRDRLRSGEAWLSRVISLADYRASLVGFREFLTDRALPFQNPRPGDPTHPESLLRALETRVDGKGVLLAGAGGVGKTRTTFETALLAEQRGWRVLFVLPGEPVVTAERIIEAVLAHGPGRTLVALEYLDQMQSVDLGVLRRHLVQTAMQRHIECGLIANCRPGLLLRPHLERDLLFDVVRLAPSGEDADRLTTHVVTHTAVRACAEFGVEEVLRVCGRRPIVALLIGQQLEKLVGAKLVSRDMITAVRSGDLAHWLKRRLREDRLVVPEAESIWTATAPPPHLVAAAATLASAPDDEAGLVMAASAALEALGEPTETAARVVGVLRAVGWLEPDGLWLYAVHDVVTDELLEQSLFDLGAMREAQFEALMHAARRRARSFGRLAKALTRFHGAVTVASGAAVRGAAQQWLLRHGEEVGRTMAEDLATHGSYALGAMFNGSVFEEVAAECWDALVAPWLAKYGKDFEARHVLYRGLRSEGEHTVRELAVIAVEWLTRWLGEREASFVLAPILWQRALDLDWPQVEAIALRWLENFSDQPEAQYVFFPLLIRGQLSSASLGRAHTLALAWLGRYHEKADARYVLDPMLGAKDLPEEMVRTLRRWAFDWLEAHGGKTEARFVIAALLGRTDLDGAEVPRAIQHAMEWLAVFSDSPAASYVIARWLNRNDVAGGTAADAQRRALEWLARHGTEPEAFPVLLAFLHQSHLDGRNAQEVFQKTLDWISAHQESAQAGGALGRLLNQPALGAPEAARARQLALRWLDRAAHPEYRELLLTSLLRRNDLTREETARTKAWAVDLLEQAPGHQGVDFLFKAVLTHDDLDESLASRARQCALAWLGTNEASPQAGFVLPSLLGRSDLSPQEAAEARKMALLWIERFPEHEGIGFVLKTLLRRGELKGTEAATVQAQAIDWMRKVGPRADGDYLLRALLSRADLTEARMAEARQLALKWLSQFGEEEQAGFVLAPLLARHDLIGLEAREARHFCASWLSKHGSAKNAGYVFGFLLRRVDFRGKAVARTMGAAHDWLILHGNDEQAGFVLASLYGRPGLTGDEIARVNAAAIAWLQLFHPRESAGHVLAPMLQASGLSEDNVRELLRLAIGWLRSWHDRRSTGQVLASLLKFRGLDQLGSPESTKVADWAATWVAAHSTRNDVGFVLVAWFTSPISLRHQPPELHARALAWADSNSAVAAGAPALTLRLCLLPAGTPESAACVTSAEQWLQAHRGHPCANDVLGALTRRHTDFPAASEAAVTALLNVAWRHDAHRVDRLLRLARMVLPESHPLRDEVEVAIDGL